MHVLKSLAQNGGTNCPACRGVSLSVTPSRALQTMADVLVRADPSKARSAGERIQADELYKAGMTLRVRPPSHRAGAPSHPLLCPRRYRPHARRPPSPTSPRAT